MLVAHVVTMDMANQYGVDLPEPGIITSCHSSASILEDARAVWIFENQCAVETAELSVMTA